MLLGSQFYIRAAIHSRNFISEAQRHFTPSALNKSLLSSPKSSRRECYLRTPWNASELRKIEIYNAEVEILSDKDAIMKQVKTMLDGVRKSSSQKPAQNSSQASSTTEPTFKTDAPAIRTLSDLPRKSLHDKTVFVRVDFNVKYRPVSFPSSPSTSSELVPNLPVTGLEVNPSSMKRIVEAMPTINYLVQSGARVVLASHLGDPPSDASASSDPTFSLAPVSVALAKLLEESTTVSNLPPYTPRVLFATDSAGESAKAAAASLLPGQVLLLENTRLYPGKAEKKNDMAYAQALVDAIHPDIYVNDAFGTAHRAHVSVVGVPSLVKGPKVAGFLLEKEVKYLSSVLPSKSERNTRQTTPEQKNSTREKAVVVLGGAKVSSKVPVLLNLLSRVDTCLIGGAMALPFLKAKGMNPGVMKEGDEAVEAAKDILFKAKAAQVEIVLPVDFVTSHVFAPEAETIVKKSNELQDQDFSIDIGPSTSAQFAKIINDPTVKVVVWNGPLGVFEWESAAKGTSSLVHALSDATKHGLISVVGGGETAQAVAVEQKKGESVTLTHVSTGGGASLEMLEGKVLPALTVLDTK